MTELTPQQLQKLRKTIDEVSDAYATNNKVIFASESKRAEAHFGHVHRSLKEWSNSTVCIVSGCGDVSVPRSHAISKGMSLSEIAENGHLLAPVFNHQSGLIQMQRVGITNATTFPGFCSTHEQLFKSFENAGAIATESDVLLQTYRTACRELFRTNYVVRQYDRMIAQYCEMRDAGLLRLLTERLQGEVTDIQLKAVSMSSDPLVEAAHKQISSVRQLAVHLNGALVPALHKAIFSGDCSDIYIDAMNLDVELPVALSGCAPFFVSVEGMERQVDLLFNIVPQAGRTLLTLSALSTQEQLVSVYKAHWFTHALKILSMLESWMINGSDQWYIKPSTWNAIPSHRRKFLLSAILSVDKNIGDDCQYSVFDGIRKALIRDSEALHTSALPPDFAAYLESERGKMM